MNAIFKRANVFRLPGKPSILYSEFRRLIRYAYFTNDIIDEEDNMRWTLTIKTNTLKVDCYKSEQASFERDVNS